MKVYFALLCVAAGLVASAVYVNNQNKEQAIISINDSAKVITYLQQSQQYLRTNKQQAKILANNALTLSLKNNYPELKALSWQSVADAERYTSNISTLLEYDKQAITVAEAIADKEILFKALNAYSRDLLAISQVNEANQEIEKLKTLNKLINNESLTAQLFYTRGLLEFKRYINLAAGKEYFNKSMQLAQKTNDQYLVAANKVILFQAHVYLGRIDTTASLIYEGLNYYKQKGLAEEEANGLHVLADCYRLQGNTSKAIEFAKKAYPIFIQHQNHLAAAKAQFVLQQIYVIQQNQPELFKAITLLEKHYTILNFELGKGMTKNLWGQYYSMKGAYLKADQYFEQGATAAANLNSTQLKGMNFTLKTEHLERQHRTQAADSMAVLAYGAVGKMIPEELLEAATKGTTPTTKDSLEKRLFFDSAFQKKQGVATLQSFRQGLSAKDSAGLFRPMLSLFDSSITVTFNKYLLNLETQYKTRQISDSLRIEMQNNVIAKGKLRQKNITLFSAVLLLAFLAIGFALQYRNRKRAVRDKQKIELLQNEIHHRVKNNLGVISRLVEVAGKTANSEPLFALKTRIKSIELLHKHLYTEEAQTGNIALQSYFEELCREIAATFESIKKITISVDAPAEVESHIAEKLGLILNELVTNSFKYAFNENEAGNIKINVRQKIQKIDMTVEDNGIGFTVVKRSTSYGMKLIKGLSHELNGKFAFTNEQGTRFQLSIPV